MEDQQRNILSMAPTKISVLCLLGLMSIWWNVWDFYVSRQIYCLSGGKEAVVSEI